MVTLENWFKEPWIKKTSKEQFVMWGRTNTRYADEELEWIYDSHVPKHTPVAPVEIIAEQPAAEPQKVVISDQTHKALEEEAEENGGNQS